MESRKARRRIPTDVYDQFPDDDSDKIVMFQADDLGFGSDYTGSLTDRHVLFYWSNGVDSQGVAVSQLIQLTGNPGNYAYYSPVARKRSPSTFTNNQQLELGTYTRVQRDKILQLASETKFYRKSVTNSCRTWTRDLLESMVNNGLLTQSTFDYLDQNVPLRKRVAEDESC